MSEPVSPTMEEIEAAKWIVCACKNKFLVALMHCPFCKKFNAATSAEHCPTCGQKLVKS